MLFKNIDLRKPHEYALIIKNVYHKIKKVYFKLFYMLKYGNSDMFHNIDIETTTYCNRRCGYCPNSVFDRSLKKNEKQMNEDLFMKIIDDLKAIKFTGRISPHLYGEPLLDSRLVILMKYIHKTLPKAKLIIYTNGDLLDISMVETLYESGVKKYVVSLHGNEKENEIAARRFDNLKKYVKDKKKDVSIKILNFHKRSYLSNRGGLIDIKNFVNMIVCQSATNPMVVNYKGDILLCSSDYLGQVSFGNVATESLMNIWYKASYKRARNDIKKGIFKLDICKKCVGSQY